MADLPPRRESRRLAGLFRQGASRAGTLAGTARGRFSRLFDHVPTDCPLCLDASRGGWPCAGCLGDMRSTLPGRRCPVCALRLEHGPRCPDCAALGPVFDRVVAAFDYVPPLDQLIWQFKNASRFQHARFMAGLLADAVRRATPPITGITIVLPVPSSRQALRRRGFNPAGEIARQLASRLELAYRPGLLRRSGEGASQKQLGRAARTGPQAGRYTCIGRVDGAVVAVVDDVLTTGATLHAVARSLKRAGAAKVVGLVVARTPYRQES